MSDEELIISDPENEASSERQSLTGLIKEHPGIAIAGGLALGLIAAALVQPSARRKVLRGTAAAAVAAGEAGRKLGKQGAAKIEELGESIGEGAGEVRRRAADAAGQARSTGLDWARAAIDILAALRR